MAKYYIFHQKITGNCPSPAPTLATALSSFILIFTLFNQAYRLDCIESLTYWIVNTHHTRHSCVWYSSFYLYMWSNWSSIGPLPMIFVFLVVKWYINIPNAFWNAPVYYFVEILLASLSIHCFSAAIHETTTGTWIIKITRRRKFMNILTHSRFTASILLLVTCSPILISLLPPY